MSPDEPLPSITRLRPPTMDDVAEAAGVSRALVSLVMRNAPNVSDRRRKAVLDAADRLGYRPNAAARSLAERRSNTLGVVVNDLHNTFFADLVDGVHEVAQANGFRLLLNTAWRTDIDERQAVEAFLEYRVDGILVLGPTADGDTLRDASKNTPVVTIGSSFPGVDAVVNDDLRGGELAAEHLVNLGHRDIVHLDGGNGAGADHRREGFCGVMESMGLEVRVVPGEFTERSGLEAAIDLVEAGMVPTAVFAANDLAAVGMIDALTVAGHPVPESVSVIGYDNTHLAQLRHIGLTTIHQPRVEMGRLAAEIVLERLESGRRQSVCHVVTPELVVRNTTAPPVVTPRRASA
ncbi:MAG: LacI family transcriptional regulator [Acidimicrobiia bacterium]|nr:LacI family transcriptional regulator [Acidimicrobiia bacterium]